MKTIWHIAYQDGQVIDWLYTPCYDRDFMEKIVEKENRDAKVSFSMYVLKPEIVDLNFTQPIDILTIKFLELLESFNKLTSEFEDLKDRYNERFQT